MNIPHRQNIYRHQGLIFSDHISFKTTCSTSTSFSHMGTSWTHFLTVLNILHMITSNHLLSAALSTAYVILIKMYYTGSLLNSFIYLKHLGTRSLQQSKVQNGWSGHHDDNKMDTSSVILNWKITLLQKAIAKKKNPFLEMLVLYMLW